MLETAKQTKCWAGFQSARPAISRWFTPDLRALIGFFYWLIGFKIAFIATNQGRQTLT